MQNAWWAVLSLQSCSSENCESPLSCCEIARVKNELFLTWPVTAPQNQPPRQSLRQLKRPLAGKPHRGKCLNRTWIKWTQVVSTSCPPQMKTTSNLTLTREWYRPHQLRRDGRQRLLAAPKPTYPPQSQLPRYYLGRQAWGQAQGSRGIAWSTGAGALSVASSSPNPS